MPVGGIIAWPKDSNPSTSSNIWLECNGQTFDTNRFPKLYKVLGSNKTPNYQGMFLRGAGSQSFSQNNGIKFGTTSTNYQSGVVGQIQGDSARRIYHDMGFFPIGMIDRSFNYSTYVNHPEFPGFKYGLDNTYNSQVLNHSSTASIENPVDINFVFNLKHYRCTCSSGGGEGCSCSPGESVESAGSDEVFPMTIAIEDCGFDNKLVMPVANEIRPVNIAVKYFIRAK